MSQATLLERRGVIGASKASAYATAILAEASLVDYWRLGDAASPVADSKGGINGTVSGGTLGTTGLLVNDADKAVTVGAGQFIDCGDNRDFAGTSAFSVELLIKPTAFSGTQCMVGKWNDASALGWLLSSQGGNLKFFRFNGSGQSTAGGALTAGVTQHVVGTYDGATMKVYKNGAQVATIASAASLPDTAQTLRIGTNQTLGAVPGVYDEVAIYNTALSAAAVLAHYNKSIGA